MIPFQKKPNNDMLRGIIIILISLSVQSALAQSEALEQIKAAKRADLLREMDKGVELMEIGEHKQADLKFRYLLETMEVIPANLDYLEDLRSEASCKFLYNWLLYLPITQE